MNPEILRDSNAHAMIVFKEGRRYLHAIALRRPPVRLVTVPIRLRCFLTPLLYRGKPYPLARAVRHFREAGRTFGITKGAARALRQIDHARKGRTP